MSDVYLFGSFLFKKTAIYIYRLCRGEPKCWYSVPGSEANAFEKVGLTPWIILIFCWVFHLLSKYCLSLFVRLCMLLFCFLCFGLVKSFISRQVRIW